MKYFAFIFILLLAAPAFATVEMDQIHAINTPAGDEIEGAMIELLTGQGNVVAIINGTGEFLSMMIDPQGSYIAIVNGIGHLIPIYDQIKAIDTPEGDEVGGAWTETLVAQGNVVYFYNGVGELETMAMEAVGSYIEIVNGHFGSQRWGEGSVGGEGTYLYNDEFVLVNRQVLPIIIINMQ